MSVKFQISSFKLHILTLCIMLLTGPRLHAQHRTGEEYDVKAAFIYKFAQFTKWPPGMLNNSTNSVTLCVASNDPSADALFRLLNHKVVGGRNIVVRRHNYNSFNIPFFDLIRQEKEYKNNTKSCHILYFGLKDRKFIQNKLNTVKKQSILTVGENEGFIQMGGIIKLFTEKKRLRFEVNLVGARRAGLELRAPMLTSAAKIYKKETYFKLTEQSIEKIKAEGIPKNVSAVLKNLKNHEYINKNEFLDALKKTIGPDQASQYKSLILKHVRKER